MVKELDPGDHHSHDSPRNVSSLNCNSSVKFLNTEIENKHHAVQPAYIDAFRGAYAMHGYASFAEKSLQIAPAALVSGYGALGFYNPAKKFLVFDQSGDKTSYMLWPSNNHVPAHHSASHELEPLQNLTETNDYEGHESEEMHENTDEINALLDSETDYGDNDEEEASTGHSPVETLAHGTPEAASSLLPAKRRRIDQDEIDASVMDTASSVIIPQEAHILTKPRIKEIDDDAESSCVKGWEHSENRSINQLKRARIQETMSILRKIIPGGKSKDAVTILDDAISILKSLRPQANLAATPL